MAMEYAECKPDLIPVSLLLEADPSKASIRSYLNDSWCFVAKDGNAIVGVSVVKPLTAVLAEVFNVAVLPERQGCGIGSELLKFTLSQLQRRGVRRVELGTGSFGYQLTYYQRLGFRVGSVINDHFISNYSDPIYEQGIQHKDMLRLYLDL